MTETLSESVQRQIEEGVSILKRGGVIAYPTDTVYGLGACFDIPAAIERIYRIKGRSRTSALPLLLANLAQIKLVARDAPQAAMKLARAFMPGGLTLVLYRPNSVPDIVTGGGQTIAVRVPAHPVPVALIEGAGAPIAGTSANLSGRPSALTAAEVRQQLGDMVDLIIDAGPAPGGIESTVVDMTVWPPVMVRKGVIALEALRRVCPEIIEKGEVPC